MKGDRQIAEARAGEMLHLGISVRATAVVYLDPWFIYFGVSSQGLAESSGVNRERGEGGVQRRRWEEERERRKRLQGRVYQSN